MPVGKRCRVVYEIREAAELLSAGKVVAFPTETVYGLGADASNPGAVRRIEGIILRRMLSSPVDYAGEMYSVMRKLDNGGFDTILAVVPPETSQWLAVRDRLFRAAV